MNEQCAIAAELEQIRKSLKKLGDDAVALKRRLVLPKDEETLKNALLSIVGNARILLSEGKTERDEQFLPWLIQRIDALGIESMAGEERKS